MTEPRDRAFQVEDRGDTSVVRFSQEMDLDEQASQSVGDQLCELVNRLGGRHLVIDFHNVVYLASGALARLISLNKMLRDLGGSLTVRNVVPRVFEIFEVTKVNTLFEVERRTADARIDAP